MYAYNSNVNDSENSNDDDSSFNLHNRRITLLGAPSTPTDALRVVDLIDKDCNINACKRRIVDVGDAIHASDVINLSFLKSNSLVRDAAGGVINVNAKLSKVIMGTDDSDACTVGQLLAVGSKMLTRSTDQNSVEVNAKLSNVLPGQNESDVVTIGQLEHILQKSVHRVLVPASSDIPMTSRLREVRSTTGFRLPPEPWPLTAEEATEINKASIILASLPERVDSLEINSLIERERGIILANNARISLLSEGIIPSDAVNLKQLDLVKNDMLNRLASKIDNDVLPRLEKDKTDLLNTLSEISSAWGVKVNTDFENVKKDISKLKASNTTLDTNLRQLSSLKLRLDEIESTFAKRILKIEQERAAISSLGAEAARDVFKD